jgi:hypothetical protein
MNDLSTQIFGSLKAGARRTAHGAGGTENHEICRFCAVDGNFLGKFMIMMIKKAGFLFTVFCLAVAGPASKGQADAYVLPSEQLLQLMAAHFSKFETLVIRHAVERESGEDTQSFEEILTMKSPDFLHAAPAEGAGPQTEPMERSFRALFLASSQSRLSDLLSGADVDLDRVSYTRVDGSIAYLIGDRKADRPKLAVEKARFLPLAFDYLSRIAHGPEFISVIFRDYRQVDKGWYPFEILCRSELGWAERYKVQSIQVNVPVEPSLFYRSQAESRPAGDLNNEEKIDAVIKAFEQKYSR